MSKTLGLAQALGAKICHDLASSIGTIDDCLGLLESDKIGEQAKQLVLEESKNLVKRIRFFRNIYGMAESETELSIANVTSVLRDFFADSAIKFSAQMNNDLSYIDANMAKVAYCLCSIASGNIAHTGSIDLYVDGEGDTLFKVLSNGRDLQLRQQSFAILNGSTDIPITLKNCSEHYASNICAKHGYKLSTNKMGGFIEYFVTKE